MILESKGLFSAFMFIVLDNQTLKDETCRIVSVRPNPIETNSKDPVTARADFFVALEVLIPPDVPTFYLNKGRGDEWREVEDRSGEILYTKEGMIEQMGPRLYVKDHLSLKKKPAEKDKACPRRSKASIDLNAKFGPGCFTSLKLVERLLSIFF